MKLLEELKEIILSLKDKEKCENPAFIDKWVKKKQEVFRKIEALPEEEHKKLSDAYMEWHEGGMKP